MREVFFADGRSSDGVRLDEGSVLVEEITEVTDDALVSLRDPSRVRREADRFQDPYSASGDVHQLAKTGDTVDQRLVVRDPVVQADRDDDVLHVVRQGRRGEEFVDILDRASTVGRDAPRRRRETGQRRAVGVRQEDRGFAVLYLWNRPCGLGLGMEDGQAHPLSPVGSSRTDGTGQRRRR